MLDMGPSTKDGSLKRKREVANLMYNKNLTYIKGHCLDLFTLRLSLANLVLHQVLPRLFTKLESLIKNLSKDANVWALGFIIANPTSFTRIIIATQKCKNISNIKMNF
jgi:hypothetical protein